MVKVAFINNMNNNFFSLVRYLREKDIDAHLFIFDEVFNFVIEADTFDDLNQLTYVHSIGKINFRDFFNPFSLKVRRAIKSLKQELKDFDVIFACGMLAFFERAGIKIDVFMPYGGDAYQLTDLFNYSRKKYFPYSFLMRYIMKYQCRAIQNVRTVVSFASNDLHVGDALTRMGRHWIDWNMPMIYPIECPINLNTWGFLRAHDFVLFSHIRQTWKTGTDYNGNDRAICAYAKFIKEKSQFKNPIFILFEYGCDVDASKALIAELQIEKYVRWMPSMQRKYIYAGLDEADLVTGIFNEEVISFGGVTFEAFSRSIPVLGNAKVNRNGVTNDLPLVHAYTVDEIVNKLVDFQENPEKYKEIGKKSKEWFDQSVGEKMIDKYVDLIQLLIEHKETKLENSPFSHLAYQLQV